ncbi:MAG: A/G-specific adenine glycosylase, partial [Clostridia bacterium]|nr:A/G-specific adenine glycosylase [Clostridia bacterium]
WEGLGYYSRARNLKKAAVEIVAAHGGELPCSYDALRALPGIGAYTAGAIASIAYGLPEPAVDGNVLRVITRLSGDRSDITKETTKKAVTAALREIYPVGKDAADLTQGLMELGQRVCIPNGEPHCKECPLGAFCRARAEELTDVIPVRTQKKPRKIQPRTILLLICGDKVALRKRGASGLLAGLWEFPGMDGHISDAQLAEELSALGIAAEQAERGTDAVHIFTHIEWHMQAYVIRCTEEAPNFTWVTKEALMGEYAVPSAYRAHVKQIAALLP